MAVALLLIGLGATAAELSPPEKNFEALWGTFNKRYAFFKERKVDWQAQYKKFRPMVDAKTTDKELFKIMCDMLAPLKDGHVYLKARRLGLPEYCPEELPRFLKEFNTRKLERQYAAMVKKTLRANGFNEPKTAAKVLSYTHNEKFGYLLVREFEGANRRKLDAGLDEALGAMDGIKGLIIDIRLNPGGTTGFTYRIANRFADKRRVGHYERTKKGPGEKDLGPLRTFHLQPPAAKKKNRTFTGPIILLTHGASYSASDLFAMIMRELPHVKIIGEPTNGIFSNMLERKLPNGWKYTLSFQVNYSAKMVCLETKGVPVHVEVLNKRADLEKGIDPVVTKALELLAK
jgi:carboxyl-terminal processing protease